jgi:hypothetical protein
MSLCIFDRANMTKPDTEELYSVAIAARSLVVDPDHRTPADTLIAAGWSDARIGTALMRLRTEWDASARPHKPTQAHIAAFAGTLDGKPLERLTRAHDIVGRWWLGEMALVLRNLRSLPSVREQVKSAVNGWKWTDPITRAPRRLEDAEAVCMAVLLHWLDHVCPACDGLKFLTIKGTPTLGVEACKMCAGTGITRTPHGEDGRRIENWLDECVAAGRQQIGARLRGIRGNTTTKALT